MVEALLSGSNLWITKLKLAVGNLCVSRYSYLLAYVCIAEDYNIL